MEYDQTGMRIRKWYAYWSLCGLGGLMQLDGGIGLDPCQSMCYDTTESLYLYDNGVLLATFGAGDAVMDLFVNGPNGRIATYPYNTDEQLYYYLTDHLGSTRVLLRADSTRALYVNYYPFGETYEVSGNQNTQYRFTGKERDNNGGFVFDYFGARFYDPRIGSFTTIDKASQFASGYVYGMNNPLMGIDQDGNLFFLAAPFLWSLATSVAVSATSYSITTDHWTLSDFGKAVGGAALSTTVTGGLASLGGPIANNFFYQAGSSFSASMATNAAMGGDISWKSALGLPLVA